MEFDEIWHDGVDRQKLSKVCQPEKNVKGQGHRSQITVKKWLTWGSDENISKSYLPISIKFVRNVKTESMRIKIDIQRNPSKVKVTGFK